MPIELPRLPVVEALPALRAALAGRCGAVLTAPPGSGKTTVAPLSLLDEPWLAGGEILLLEPRRVAARAAAWRMSEIAGEQVGGLVGYRMRMERRTSRDTRVTVLTEGLLARRIISDPELGGVGLVIFDEFHERSIHADFGLALALDVQRALRPDLRLLVMSATIDAEFIAGRLAAEGEPAAPVVSAAGRMFPVETGFLDLRGEPSVARRTAAGVRRALSEHGGSVLAFLPGEGEIRACAAILSEPHAVGADVDVMPLYAALGREEQNAALRPSPPGRRKVVLATSIAESSLTIDGVSCVVDSGMARASRFSPETGMSHLETIRISRDRADQRTGRAGRLGPGFCLRLWSREDDARLAPSAPPEILCADLASVALACADWGASAPDALSWPTPPPRAAWTRSRELLRNLGALDAAGAITPHGRELSKLGVHPRLAHMIVASGRSDEACLLAAALSENIPPNARPGTNAEHLVRDLREREGVVPHAVRSRIERLAGSFGPAKTGGTESTGALLALAYPDRVGRRRAAAKDAGRYQLRIGRGVKLPDRDPLAESEWIVVAGIDDSEADAVVRLAAPISANDVERLFSGEFRKSEVHEWNRRHERVDCCERESLGAVTVRERPLRAADPVKTLACLLEGIRSSGVERLGWSDAARALQTRAAFLRRELPEAGLPDVSDEALRDTLGDWLGDRLYGVSSLARAAEIDLFEPLSALLSPFARLLGEEAPTHITAPSGSNIRVDYSGDAPSASVRIQETFGMQRTPRVARGRVPVVLKLLSPAMRPVQITADLESFWRDGYPEVRKELRGRYPRHFWPDDPLHAAPTRRAKPRGT